MPESITQFYNEAYEAEMNITLPRETVQQALDALEYAAHGEWASQPIYGDAIAALRTALEAAPAAPKEEPDALGLFHNQAHTDLGPATRLKAAPAAQPLSDEQILMTLRPEVWEHVEGHYKTQMLTDARAIEAAHGIVKEQK